MDEREFTAWATGCERALLRFTYLLTGDLHRAQDLVQEALTKVALRWPRLRGGNPTAYARRVIARDHISWWRRTRRELSSDDVPDRGGTPDRDPESALVVNRALSRLTAAQRAVLVLRHFDDLTERETADVLGVSVGTVKSTNAAALARLRTGAPELLDDATAWIDRPGLARPGRGRRARRRARRAAMQGIIHATPAGEPASRRVPTDPLHPGTPHPASGIRHAQGSQPACRRVR